MASHDTEKQAVVTVPADDQDTQQNSQHTAPSDPGTATNERAEEMETSLERKEEDIEAQHVRT